MKLVLGEPMNILSEVNSLIKFIKMKVNNRTKLRSISMDISEKNDDRIKTRISMKVGDMTIIEDVCPSYLHKAGRKPTLQSLSFNFFNIKKYEIELYNTDWTAKYNNDKPEDEQVDFIMRKDSFNAPFMRNAFIVPLDKNITVFKVHEKYSDLICIKFKKNKKPIINKHSSNKLTAVFLYIPY